MTAYEDRLENVKGHAHDAANEPQLALGEDAWPDAAAKARFDSVMAYVQTVLETSDPELLTSPVAEQIVNACLQFANNPQAVPANVDPWCDALLVAIGQLPASRGRSAEQAVKKAAVTFQRSTQQRLKDLSKDFSTVQAEVDRVKSDIERRDSDSATALDARRVAFELEMQGLIANFDAQLHQHASQIEGDTAAVAKLRTRQTSDFEEGEERRNTEAKQRLALAGKELGELVERAKIEVDERIAEIRRMESESAQLVGAIGLAGTAERYAEEVKEQRAAADRWRKATVVLALLAVIAGVYAIAQDPTAELLAGKLALSLILGGIATYAARQSANHRRREQHARDLQLELTAFSPFIEPLSPEQQEEERVIMTRKTFGKTTRVEAPQEEPGPTPLSFMLQRRRKEAAEAPP